MASVRNGAGSTRRHAAIAVRPDATMTGGSPTANFARGALVANARDASTTTRMSTRRTAVALILDRAPLAGGRSLAGRRPAALCRRDGHGKRQHAVGREPRSGD